MRTLVRVTVNDVQAGNKAITEGYMLNVINHLVETTQPEASFFLAENGHRTALLFFDLKDVSDIPRIAEPLFTKLNAKVEFVPVMNQEELGRGLEAWTKTQ